MRNRNYDPSIEQTQWNMAQQFCFDLAELMKDIKEAIKLKDWDNVFQLCEEIYTRINYLIKKTIAKDDKILFDIKYSQYLKDISDNFDNTRRLLYGKNIEQNLGIIRQNLQKIRLNIYWFLWDLNLIFPEDNMRDPMEDLKKGYE